MKVEISVPEVVSIFKEIQEQPDKIFEMIRVDIRQSVGEYLSEFMEMELTRFLGRAPYERIDGKANHRNGTYPREFTMKGIGKLDVRVPRDREGEFKTQIIPRSKRYEDELRQDLSMMFLTGVSTRTLSMMSERLIGRKISPTEVSNANKELIEAVEKWRSRDLSGEPIKYIFLDGVNFDMRIEGSIEKVPVLAAIGVTETGHKRVLGFQAGDKESAPTWREFFKISKIEALTAAIWSWALWTDCRGWKRSLRKNFQKPKSRGARSM